MKETRPKKEKKRERERERERTYSLIALMQNSRKVQTKLKAHDYLGMRKNLRGQGGSNYKGAGGSFWR